ncbi:MAG: ferrous iron transport protein B [Deltaproteobacteria bacterium]|nr:ferrous iron transport protein B [Deltaproteobacteria bacterium]
MSDPIPAGLERSDALRKIVALAGNPNSGKTTLFNRLTGLNQKVANYPGVTVEKKWGSANLHGKAVRVVDVPGTYSLVSRSREEAIAFEVVTGKQEQAPAVIVLVVDASNLSRNLYFALQVLELGRPVVIALNMIDRSDAAGIRIDSAQLSASLGAPVVPIVAATGQGVEELREAIALVLSEPPSARFIRRWKLDARAEQAIAGIAAELAKQTGSRVDPEAEAVWLLSSLAAAKELDASDDPIRGDTVLERLREKAEQALVAAGPGLLSAVIEGRYRVVDELVKRVESRPKTPSTSSTDRVDAVLLHPIFGPLAFLLVMAIVFQSIFAWSDPLIGLIEEGFAAIGASLRATLPQGPLADLAVEGVVAGVGAVLVFIPQIAVLFFFMALLEDFGYLARAAYLMDRVMARVGLHGRAFVPLMSGFACAVPAILSTRTIENVKDRLITILVIPFVTCSARLPVYGLVISALFARDEKIFGLLSVGAALLLAMYVASVIVTLLAALVLKKTILRSPTPPLILELPPYRRPSLKDALRRAYDRCLVFVKDAGSIILACSVVLWALLSYPRSDALEALMARPDAELATEARATEEGRLRAAQLESSLAGRIGRFIEPVIEPIGFDWKIGIGLIGSFAAREVLVSTLGLVYGIGKDADEESVPLREALRAERNPHTGERAYTPLVGLSLMIFFLLACQCLSTVAVVRRETGSWRWPAFMVASMTLVAYAGALAVFQGGKLLGFS